MARKKQNPNGANQYLVDPRQAEFFKLYLDPKSPTFSNALQSALRAGFEKSYAENLTSLMPSWLSEKLGEVNMLGKAERNLDKFLDLEEDKPEKLRVKADITKFVAERVGKAKYGSKENERPTVQNNFLIISDEQRSRIARRIIASDESSQESSS